MAAPETETAPGCNPSAVIQDRRLITLILRPRRPFPSPSLRRLQRDGLLPVLLGEVPLGRWTSRSAA